MEQPVPLCLDTSYGTDYLAQIPLSVGYDLEACSMLNQWDNYPTVFLILGWRTFILPKKKKKKIHKLLLTECSFKSYTMSLVSSIGTRYYIDRFFSSLSKLWQNEIYFIKWYYCNLNCNIIWFFYCYTYNIPLYFHISPGSVKELFPNRVSKSQTRQLSSLGHINILPVSYNEKSGIKKLKETLSNTAFIFLSKQQT